MFGLNMLKLKCSLGLVLIPLVYLTTSNKRSEAQSVDLLNSLLDKKSVEQVQLATNILKNLSPLDRFSLSSFLGIKSRPETNPKVTSASGDIQCGKRVKSYPSRIVGGHVSTIGDFPWMISLQREKSGWFGFTGFYHSCGGSLITDSWILTAAHCLYNRDETLRAVAGTDNLNFLYRAQIRSIKQQIIHPQFDITTYNNDIALLKVDQPFNLRSSFSHVGVVCLEPGLDLWPYDIAIICGFGSRAFREKTRSHLYQTEIAIIDQKVCNKSFGGMINDNMLCAGGMIANKRDACSGDSGGPLMMDVSDSQESSGEHVSQVGVVSFGNDCALQNYPGIYTRVSSYYNWILDNIDESLVEPSGLD